MEEQYRIWKTEILRALKKTLFSRESGTIFPQSSAVLLVGDCRTWRKFLLYDHPFTHAVKMQHVP